MHLRLCRCDRPVLGGLCRRELLFAVLCASQEPVGQHGHDGQRNQQRGAQRHRDCDRKRPEELTNYSGDNGNRRKHRDGGQGRSGDRTGDLLDRRKDVAGHESPVPGGAALDVLNHDD